MPTLRSIFGTRINSEQFGIFTVKDSKPNQCQHIDTIDPPPFIKRCTAPKAISLDVCLSHAFTVNYRKYLPSKRVEKEATAYFNSVGQAEYFRRNKAQDKWTETNYEIPKPEGSR